jgi:hypothetical protein
MQRPPFANTTRTRYGHVQSHFLCVSSPQPPPPPSSNRMFFIAGDTLDQRNERQTHASCCPTDSGPSRKVVAKAASRPRAPSTDSRSVRSGTTQPRPMCTISSWAAEDAHRTWHSVVTLSSVGRPPVAPDIRSSTMCTVRSGLVAVGALGRTGRPVATCGSSTTRTQVEEAKPPSSHTRHRAQPYPTHTDTNTHTRIPFHSWMHDA